MLSFPCLPLARKETVSWVYLPSSKKHFCYQQGASAPGLQTDFCLLWKKTTGRNLNQEILTNTCVRKNDNVCSFLTNLKSFITIAKNKLTMGTILPKSEAQDICPCFEQVCEETNNKVFYECSSCTGFAVRLFEKMLLTLRHEFLCFLFSFLQILDSEVISLKRQLFFCLIFFF